MSKTKKIENIKNLRDDLLETFERLKAGELGLKEAKEMANVSGKIISSAKLQMEYNAYTQTQRTIKFLECDE